MYETYPGSAVHCEHIGCLARKQEAAGLPIVFDPSGVVNVEACLASFGQTAVESCYSQLLYVDWAGTWGITMIWELVENLKPLSQSMVNNGL